MKHFFKTFINICDRVDLSDDASNWNKSTMIKLLLQYLLVRQHPMGDARHLLFQISTHKRFLSPAFRHGDTDVPWWLDTVIHTGPGDSTRLYCYHPAQLSTWPCAMKSLIFILLTQIYQQTYLYFSFYIIEKDKMYLNLPWCPCQYIWRGVGCNGTRENVWQSNGGYIR